MKVGHGTRLISVAMVFLVLSVPLSVGAMASSGLGIAANLLLQVLQWLASALIQLALVGAVVAIARSEMAREMEDGVAAAG